MIVVQQHVVNALRIIALLVSCAVLVLVAVAIVGMLLSLCANEQLYDHVSRAFGDSRLWLALVRTLALALAGTFMQILIALIVTVFVRRLPAALKILLIVPVLIAPATAAVAFFLWLSPAVGPANEILRGIAIEPPGWFSDTTAMLALVLVVDSWQWIPLLVALFVHRIERIPKEHFEQAAVESCGRLRTWRAVTLPALEAIIIVVGAIRFFDWLRMYDVPFVLFGGAGPANAGEFFSNYVRALTFQVGNQSYAAFLSIAYLILCILLLALALRSTTVRRVLPWHLRWNEQ